MSCQSLAPLRLKYEDHFDNEIRFSLEMRQDYRFYLIKSYQQHTLEDISIIRAFIAVLSVPTPRLTASPDIRHL